MNQAIAIFLGVYAALFFVGVWRENASMDYYASLRCLLRADAVFRAVVACVAATVYLLVAL